MSKKPFVVGIAGGTCSGKSTLAERIQNSLPEYKVVQINMDRYFKKEPPNTVAPITRKVYVEHNHPDSFDLDRFYADFDAAVAPGSDADVVVVEGLLILYLEHIREQLDLKVFVDLKSDERAVRRIVKFMARGQSFEDVTSRFLDTVRYRHDEFVEPTRWFADVVINGVLDSHKGLDVVLSFIRANVG